MLSAIVPWQTPRKMWGSSFLVAWLLFLGAFYKKMTVEVACDLDVLCTVVAMRALRKRIMDGIEVKVGSLRFMSKRHL